MSLWSCVRELNNAIPSLSGIHSTRGTQPSLTFPLGAVVHLRLLAVLQVRTRQDVGGRGSVQQLLRAATVQAVLTAVGGADTVRGGLQTAIIPTERTPGGAGSLSDSAARDHREVLTETKRDGLRCAAGPTVCS